MGDGIANVRFKLAIWSVGVFGEEIDEPIKLRGEESGVDGWEQVWTGLGWDGVLLMEWGECQVGGELGLE